MWEYTFMDVDPYALYHYGILGQKWGIRRYQNSDGTLTEAGKRRYWGGGSDYTHVGRKRYIKDLVSDYNAINGTKVDLKKAVVRVDGKYYTGKGKELDPRGIEIIQGKLPETSSEPVPSKLLDASSKKHDIDSKNKYQMTSEELRIAKEYYERLNGYEKAGIEYAERHKSKKSRDKEKRNKFLSDQGEKFGAAAIAAAGAGLGAWIENKIKSNIPKSKAEAYDLEIKRLNMLKLAQQVEKG